MASRARPHVLIVHHTWDAAEPGGVVAMIQDLLGGLEPVQPCSLLIESWPDRQPRALQDRDGRCYYRLRLSAPPEASVAPRALLAWLIRLPSAVWRLRRFCRARGIDVAHLHYPTPSYLTFALCHAIGGPPYIATCHRGDIEGFPAYGPLGRWAVRWILRRAAAVTAVSDWLGRQAMDTVGLREQPITIANGYTPKPIGAHRGESIEAALSAGDYAILVGNCRPYKGHDIALRAWVQISKQQPKLALVIVGGGPGLEEMKTLAESLGISERVHFLGHLPRARTTALIAAARLLVAPSRNEGQGIVILEAGEACTPVVCSNIPPFLEMIRNGKYGYIFNSEDPTALAQAVNDVIADPIEARRRAMQLRQDVQQHYTVAAMVSAYQNLYDEARAANLKRTPPLPSKA